MSDNTPKVSGVPEPKGTAWLKEVRLDAARNVVQNLREQSERQEFAAAKARGITVEEIVAKGKEDLDSRGFLDAHNERQEEAGFDYTEEQSTDSDADQNGRTNVRAKASKKESN